MQEFIIDDGQKEYCFKNKADEVFARFKFNPTDTTIIDRYKATLNDLNSLEYDTNAETIDAVSKLDAQIKALFETLLGADAANGLFMTYNPCSIFPNGSLYSEIIIEYIGKIIEDEFKVRLEAKEAKIKKATAKYTK